MKLFFDRFFQDEAGVSPRADGEAHGESVIGSIRTLLNTRSPFSAQQIYSVQRRTVLDYGLPDFFHHATMGSGDITTLGNLVRATIAAHEPRLCVESVNVDRKRKSHGQVDVVIAGHLVDRSGSGTRVSFPVEISGMQGI